jgi:AcrR family transcriptional regulator
MTENLKALIQEDTKQNIDNSSLQKKRGRPKCFDEKEVLRKAMLLFWEYGYESTSIGDLTKVLGVTAPSLYSTFGDKAELFQKCLQYYDQNESCEMEKIFNQATSIKQGLHQYLLQSTLYLIQKHKPAGCMYVVSTMNCSQENQFLQDALCEKRHQKKQKIYEYLEKAQIQNELRDHVDIRALSDYYTTVMQGMSIQARDGAQVEQLKNVVELAMQTWNIYNNSAPV